MTYDINPTEQQARQDPLHNLYTGLVNITTTPQETTDAAE